jgi:alginate O-acetyltransferase complex protein AlgI
MSFNSSVFLFGFLPLVVAAYYALQFFAPKAGSARNVLLVVASLAFYSWGGLSFTVVLVAVSLFDYAWAFVVSRQGNPTAKRALLAAGIVANFGLLVGYKYLGFLDDIVFVATGSDLGFVEIAMPLGLSFFTFAAVSYLIDVYRGTVAPCRNIVNMVLWMSFFPKIISGPIVRYADVEDQFSHRKTTLEGFSEGLIRFVRGMAKKVIIADTLGLLVDSIFSSYTSGYGLDVASAWLGALCYTLQIFFDFSGYSDMAIGLGAMFGFRFKENFDYPYISKTITEFWRRWHISLSTWFRDYLYFPLGGSRRGNVYFNLIVVFVASGLWHGAAWTFVLWGAWHGIALAIEKFCWRKRWWNRIPAGVHVLITLLVVVLGWVIFRAPTISVAWGYLGVMFGIGASAAPLYEFSYYFDPRVAFLFVVGVVCSTELVKKATARLGEFAWYGYVRALSVPLLFVLCLLFVVNSTYSPFLYAQF